MAKREEDAQKALGRDPFEGMELPLDLEEEIESPDQETEGESSLEPVGAEAAPSAEVEVPAPEPYVQLPLVEVAEPAPELRGKGVWLLYSRDLDLAIEMALAIGASHVLYKTGERGMFFVEASRRVWEQVRQAGLVPFAWMSVYGDDPIAEAEVAIKSARTGYEGIVFHVEDQASGRHVAAAALGQQLLDAGLDPARLYYTSFPNIWQHLDVPYREMNAFCRGGFMPQCYPAFQRTPRTVIKKWAYGEHERWSQEWGDMPSLYPILAAYRGDRATRRLSVQEFLEWAQTLATHAPSFYSVYRAGTTDRDLWSILAALGESAPVPARRPVLVEPVPAPSPAEVPAAPPEEEEEPASAPVYHVVTVNDTVWGICERYGMTRDQFWEWNGYLWDERWLPRDGIYLQEGWRVRVE